MVGIELFGQKIAPWLIVFSIFAVNFRHGQFGRVRAAHRKLVVLPEDVAFFVLTDPQFAGQQEEGKPSMRLVSGLGAAFWVPWIVETGLGAYFGKHDPWKPACDRPRFPHRRHASATSS